MISRKGIFWVSVRTVISPKNLVEIRVFERIIGAQKGGSAERASGVREQPCVYAIDMKSMAADGEQSQPVLVGKFAETNGAIEWLFQTHNIFV